MTTATVLLPFLLLPLSAASDLDTPDSAKPAWNADLAAKYLDERAQTWFDFSSAERGQGNDKINCVSCHTLLPYILARPTLRKLTAPAKPMEFEQKVLEQITRRVEHWSELDSKPFRLFYDFSDQKKKESWGTEAVLNSLILARNDHDAGRIEPSAVTKKALANLWQTQITEGNHAGSWDWLDFGLEPWETKDARHFGATLAAIALGTAPGYYTIKADAGLEKNVDQLRGYLRGKATAQSLYYRVWSLWAAAKVSGIQNPQEQKELIQEILQKQQADGGWSPVSLGIKPRSKDGFQGIEADAYPTAFVLHVLQTAGVSKKDAAIAKGLAWLQAHQASTGEWRSLSVNKKRDPESHVGKFMTDAATAYAVLALGH
jgi:squalene-hopene/tetraprenyl-beta-curcumene cyclase